MSHSVKTVSVAVRPRDESIIHTLDELLLFLKKRHIRVLLSRDSFLPDDIYGELVVDDMHFTRECDIIIVIGGDGTFLRAARLFIGTGKPIFGINRGRLGFLTEFNPDEYTGFLEGVLEGNYETSSRYAVEAVHIRNGSRNMSAAFLNDAVISKGAFSRPLLVELEINGDFINSFLGDGLIISTPTGSTAYSLSAGGPLINPEVRDVFLFNPICPHTLSLRPIIIPATSVLKARILTDIDNLLLTIDGQEAIGIDGGDEIIFRQTDKTIQVVTHPHRKFYAILQEKLGWG